MSHETRPANRKEMLAFGAIATAIGLYFSLLGLDLAPPPGGKSAPPWIVFCAGVVFLSAGSALLLQVAGGAKDSNGLPPDAPQWIRAIQYLLSLVIFGSFAAIGTWIAIGPGERAISVTLQFFSGPANEAIGRAAFGVGAIIICLCLIAAAVSGVRKLLRRPPG